MIDVTVKTLDSQNHSYSTPDDFTVRQFKEKIANSVGIPADKQRLIYCGRVLQDDKKLLDYDVNGKVIHLVQRPPPASSSGADSSASTTSSTSSSATSSNQHRPGFPPHLGPNDANSYLLGAFTIPAETVDPTQVQQVVQRVVSGMGEFGRNATVMSHTSDDGSTVDVHINLGQIAPGGDSHRRLRVAQDFIRRANVVMNFRGSSNNSSQSPEETQNLENSRSEQDVPRPANVEAPANQAVNGGMPMYPRIQLLPNNRISIENAIHMGAAAAAFAAAMAPSRIAAAAAANSGSAPVNSETANAPAEPTPAQPTENGRPASQETPQPQPQPQQRSPQRQAPLQATALADVVRDLISLQNRLAPRLVELETLLRDDRNFQGNAEEATRNQGLFNSVSQVMHLISHVYHAMSDFQLDMGQNPPRTVYSRPVAIPSQTAVIQQDIPIQAHINLSTNLNPNASQNTSSANTTSGSQPTTAPAAGTGPNVQTPTAPSAEEPNVAPPNPPPNPTAIPMAGLFGNSPGPVVFMEMGPGSITLESITATVTEVSGPHPVTGPRFSAAPFPIVLPPDVIQNLTQSLGQINGANQRATQANENTTTNSLPPLGRGRFFGMGHLGQTNPTAATRTRTTARPAQSIPLGMPGFAVACFDPFLPCSSRHGMPIGRHVRTAVRTPNQMPQAGVNTALINDRQLGNVVASLMSTLFTHANASTNTTTTTASAPTAAPPAPAPASAAVNGQRSNQSMPGSIQASGFRNVIAQLMNNTMFGGGQQSSTMAEFLRMLPDYEYQEGQSVVSDLVMCVARQLTWQEFLDVLFGRTAALNRLHRHLQEFTRNRILNGREATEDNVRAAAVEHARALVSDLQSAMAGIEIREGVDYSASVTNFCEQRFSSLIHLILSAESENFGSNLYELCRRIVSEDVVLGIYCFRNGQQGFQRMVENRVRQLASDLDPVFQQWMIGICASQVSGMIPHITVREADVMRYVVRTSTPSASAPVAEVESSVTASTVGSSSNAKPEISSSSVSESMEVELNDDDNNATGFTTPPTGPAGLPNVDDEILLDAEDAPDDNSWHTAVPASWVPIIAEDVQRQRRFPGQRPFSDGYLGTIPPKRRKLLCGGGRLNGAVDATSVLCEALRRSIASSGVQPRTSVESLTQEVAASANLNVAFREQFNRTVSKRLQEDPDYISDKFPNASALFKAKRKDSDC